MIHESGQSFSCQLDHIRFICQFDSTMPVFSMRASFFQTKICKNFRWKQFFSDFGLLFSENGI